MWRVSQAFQSAPNCQDLQISSDTKFTVETNYFFNLINNMNLTRVKATFLTEILRKIKKDTNRKFKTEHSLDRLNINFM